MMSERALVQLLAVTAIGLALMLPRGGPACSCAGIGTVEERLARADAVFVGEVKELRVPLMLEPWFFESTPQALWMLLYELFDPEVITVFAVSESWKGIDSPEVEIHTGAGLCCDCTLGARFRPGERWLLYAHEFAGELSVGKCSFPELAGSADADLAALGPGRAF